MLNESVFAKVDASVRDLDLETKSGKVPTNGIAISELSETRYIFKTQSDIDDCKTIHDAFDFEFLLSPPFEHIFRKHSNLHRTELF